MRENKFVFIISLILSCVFFSLSFIPNQFVETIFISLFASMIISFIVSFTNFLIIRNNTLRTIFNEMRELNKIEYNYIKLIFLKFNIDDIENINKIIDGINRFCSYSDRVRNDLEIIHRQFLRKNSRNLLSLVHDKLAVKIVFYKTFYHLFDFVEKELVFTSLDDEDMKILDKYINDNSYYKIMRSFIFPIKDTNDSERPIDVLDILKFEIKKENSLYSFSSNIKQKNEIRLTEALSITHYKISEKYNISDKFLRKYGITKDLIEKQ